MSASEEKSGKAGRQDRLKAALRANLRRRKAQSRDREARNPDRGQTDDAEPSDS